MDRGRGLTREDVGQGTRIDRGIAWTEEEIDPGKRVDEGISIQGKRMERKKGRQDKRMEGGRDGQENSKMEWKLKWGGRGRIVSTMKLFYCLDGTFVDFLKEDRGPWFFLEGICRRERLF